MVTGEETSTLFYGDDRITQTVQEAEPEPEDDRRYNKIVFVGRGRATHIAKELVNGLGKRETVTACGRVTPMRDIRPVTQVCLIQGKISLVRSALKCMKWSTAMSLNKQFAFKFIGDLFAKGISEDVIYDSLKEEGFSPVVAQFYLDQFLNTVTLLHEMETVQ